MSTSWRGQRWLVRGLVDSEFALKRHEASDAMTLVYGLSPVRSRQIHARTLLEVRRQLLDVVELPAVTRANPIGTRGKALRDIAISYRRQISADWHF